MSTKVSPKPALISNLMATSNSASSTTSPEPIPKLGEILNDEVEPNCTYSKINFMKFLVEKHCIENYDFYMELKSIINNYELFCRYNSTSEWFSIYNQFIETEIINLPADITLKLFKNQLPCIGLLLKIEKIISNYLLASYYEFISHNKYLISEKNRTSSSCSTSTSTTNSSVNNTDSSCFTKLNNSLSPDSTSMCSDFSFYFHHSDDDDLDTADSNSNENNVASTINNEVCYCTAGLQRSLDGDITMEDDNGEIDMNVNENNISNSCNDITLKSNKSSNSSFSNITVCDRCGDGSIYGTEIKGGKSWSKFTKKLKWRRKSSSS